MRGTDSKQATMLTLISPEKRVPANHPLRPIKRLAEEALAQLSPKFDAMSQQHGTAAIPRNGG